MVKRKEEIMKSGLIKTQYSDRPYPEIDRLAISENPPTLEVMMGIVDSWHTRESPRAYLIRRGFHKTWAQNREKVEEKAKDIILKNKLIGNIAQSVFEHVLMKEDPYVEKVIQLGIQRGSGLRSDPTSIKRAANVLRAYDELSEKGEKFNLSKIGIAVGGVRYNTVSRILRRAGINIGEVKRKRILLSDEMKKTVICGRRLDMSGPDKAYFLQVPVYIPNNYRNYSKREESKQLKGRKIPGILLRIASQIYAAQDSYEENSDFLIDETAEIEEIANLIGVPEGIVRKRINERPELEPKIAKALRFIYPNRKCNVPYLTSEELK